MTVATTAAAASYVGNGTSASFSIPFEAVDNAAIKVYLNDILQSVGYQISGSILVPGAFVVFTTPPAIGITVDIIRSTPLTQSTIYTAYGPYKAKQVESDFDRSFMIMQELQHEIENPPAIVFPPDQTAATVPFAPTGNILSSNVQAAIAETDGGWRSADLLLVPKSTGISSGDPSAFTVSNPTLAQDIVLSPRTNVPLGLVKLDASGKIPPALQQALGVTFKGTWGPPTNGSTPPGSGTQGDMYVFDANGNMTLLESINTTPHTVAVVINDYMVYSTVGVAGWYYVHNAQQQNIPASAVSFAPAGTLVSSNVQAAITELDFSISDRFHDQASEIVIERFNGVANEPVIISSVNGVRLLRSSRDRLSLSTNGVDLWGNNPNSNSTQQLLINLLSSDGVQQAYLQMASDLQLMAVRQGAPVSILVTGATGAQIVVTGTPDGESWLHYAGNRRLGATVNGATLVGLDIAATLSPHAALTYLSSDAVQLARVGFVGPQDFFVAIDRANSNFTVQLANGATFQLTPTSALLGGVASLSLTVTGQVISGTSAPTAANHLTRKDYVDSRLAGFTSADTVLTAAFSVPHGLGAAPSQIDAYLVNFATQYGHTPGQFLTLPRVGAVGGSFTGYQIWADATSIGFGSTGTAPFIAPRLGGAPAQITESLWRVRLFARK
jgi:hypothetical protein